MPMVEFEPVGHGGPRQEIWYDLASEMPPFDREVEFDGLAYRRALPRLLAVSGTKDETFRSWNVGLWDPTVRHHDKDGVAVFRTKSEAREWAKRSETEHGGYAYDA